MADVDDSPAVLPARAVEYCAICTFPYEYCEYGSSLSKCKANLQQKNPALFAQLYSEEALTDKLKSLTTEQVESLERDSAKRERKAEAKAEKERAQLAVRRATYPDDQDCPVACRTNQAQGDYLDPRTAPVFASASAAQGDCKRVGCCADPASRRGLPPVPRSPRASSTPVWTRSRSRGMWWTTCAPC